MDALIAYSDRRVAAALAHFPEGTYVAEDFLDDDGINDEPIRISVAITIADGILEFDLTNSDDQVEGPMNATAPMAYSGASFVLKTLLPLDIPTNGGFYRHVRVRSRPGSVVHAVHPAAVAGGWEVCFRVAETAFKALAPVFGDLVPAATKGIICNVSFGGRRPDSGEYYVFYETIAGGYGGHRSQDGMDGVQSHIHNTENAPIEEIELHYPVRFKQFSLIPDSGGAGTHRGGLGVRRDYWFEGHEATFSIVSDRSRFAPWGLNGGHAGRSARYIRDPDGKGEQLGSKATIRLAPGEVVSVQTPGGGGYGHPYERDPERVAADGRLGKVSVAAALKAYGVIIDEREMPDLAATKARRARQEGQDVSTE
jgi:N-methylhydantoinase B